jgi:hypothetical protein
MYISYWQENQEERGFYKDVDISGMIILMWISEWDVMDRINLAQDRTQWKDLVNTAMNLRVPKTVGKFLSSSATGDSSLWSSYHFTISHHVLPNVANMNRQRHSS